MNFLLVLLLAILIKKLIWRAIDPQYYDNIYAQTIMRVGNDSTEDSRFGASVPIDTDTMAVGAPEYDCIIFFRRNPDSWLWEKTNTICGKLNTITNGQLSTIERPK